MPPKEFEPLAANAEELEEYGFPARPSEPEALSEWEEDMAAYSSVPGEPEEMCRADEMTEVLEPESSEAKGEAAEGAQEWSTSNWAGFLATELGDPNYYVGIQGDYVQPNTHPDLCSGSQEVSWIGLGGYGIPSLTQTGTGIDEKNHFYAWLEWLGPKGTGINIHRIRSLHIHPGDHIHLYMSYGQSTHVLNFYIADNTTGEAKPAIFRKAPRFYSGETGDFIDERPTINGVYAHLKNFAKVGWSNTRVQAAGGSWRKLGKVAHRRLHMRNSAGEPQLAAPGYLKPSGAGFQDNWMRCHG